MKLPVEAIGTGEQVQNNEQDIESQDCSNIIVCSCNEKFDSFPCAGIRKIGVVKDKKNKPADCKQQQDKDKSLEKQNNIYKISFHFFVRESTASKCKKK